MWSSKSKRTICVICGLLLSALVAHAQEQQFANIGDLKLQNGGVIRNCRVGYRTFGTLDHDKSNVVVFPTCNYAANPARALDFAFGELLLTTPTDYNRRKTREQVFADLEKARNDAKRFDANDKIRQTQAMMSLDVANNYSAVKAKVLVVVSKFDHVVTPGPAREFAKSLGAKLIELDSDCGHLATACESSQLTAAVTQFLAAD